MAPKRRCKFNETLQSEFKFIKKVEADNDYDVYCTICSNKETWTNQQKTSLEKYLIKNEMLYRTVDKKELWEVLNSMRKSITVKFHDLSDYFAIDHNVSKIKEKYYFPKMRRYVKYHINVYPECLLRKIPRGKRPRELHPITPGKQPFEMVNMDHVGPFLRSTKGNNFVLSIVQHSLICVRHPQANGQVKRVNATLVTVIQANMITERSWDRELAIVEYQLNNSYNKTIGDTPFKVLYGYYANFVDGELSSMVVPDQGVQNVRTVQEKVREKIMAEHQQWKLRENLNYSTKAHVSKLKAYHLPEEEDDYEDDEDKPETEESHLEEDKETLIQDQEDNHNDHPFLKTIIFNINSLRKAERDYRS
ncbi:hypothetical protein AGLY_013687 [Aphis glycines]|uniref:Integrase catalytic domain-containing protein n=1 Tax=Aphis glycines TaxID=307491 RepID=A0A6G0T949_APHGL|nr:hypothetical protein AGLY_013687 [Aphis glycines]